MNELQNPSIEDLKKLCLEEKIVNKRKKINQRKDKEHFLFYYLSNFFQAPIKIAIDILFEYNGIKPVCVYCSKQLDFYNLANSKPIKYAHKECASNERVSKINWGEAVKKRKSTCKERYGSEVFFDYEKMVIQAQQTKLEKYGSETYVNPNKAKATKLEKYGSETYRNDKKIRTTCKERYGSENPFGSTSIINYVTETLTEKYGGRGFQSGKILESIEKTNLEKYGSENAMCNSEVSKKSSETRRKKYFGPKVYEQLTVDLHKIYQQYVETNDLSISKLAKSLNLDKTTLARSFIKEGFEVLDRSYKCSTSKGELYLYNLIKEIDPSLEIIMNTRSIIAPKEIDLWIPSRNLGIEYHGSYWHQEDKAKDTHYTKASLAFQKQVRLIQIFDFELVEHLDKIKDMLRSALNIYDQKVAARDCSVVILDSRDARKFCEEHHLQGYSPAKINYALSHKDLGIVQLLSVSTPRFSTKFEWELIRSCTRRGFMVLGGLEKLWKHFVKGNNPQSVISYADARFFTGKSYRKLGFEYSRQSGSGYFWSNGVQRLSRYKTQKRNLIEDQNNINKSEKQIMESKGFYKVLDAGNHVYSWTIQ